MTAGVAVIGLDCRFPGGADPEALWRLLLTGGDAVGERPPSRGGGRDTHGGFLADADAFDHAFFGIGLAEAAAMDPQQRLLLQTAWRALEDAGLNPPRLAGSATGVFVGAMADDWSRLQLDSGAEITPRTGTGAGRSMLANRLSYQLDLRGPSLTVDSACSSALVAVHLAASALRAGDCDTALVGGVNLVMSDVLDEIYDQAGLAAPDGRCKPFGAGADGIGRAEGVGVVVLRRLADARSDGSTVHAVLRGSAVNQDGRSNGMMAPSRRAQREVMLAACRRAGVDPGRISWVEAHGTGTPVGDLIEARALGDVYGGDRQTPCGVGSLKGNIGHTEGAAGLAGLIKVVLALRHRVVPPVRTPGGEHPALDLRGHGLRLLDAPLPLPPDAEVLAAVSSFGMGGSNAHAVLSTAPVSAPQPTGAGQGPAAPGVFTLTSVDAAGLRRNLLAQAEALADRVAEPVAPLCWSSNRVRVGLPHRIALPAADTAGLVRALRSAAEAGGGGSTPGQPPLLAYLFTGQGAQYPGMTARMYRESAPYRHHLDAASRALEPHLRGSVADLLLDADPRVHRTGWTQPAVFAVQCALAATLAEFGVRPDAVLGHSIGEFAAAVAAGALALEEAAALVAARAAAMDAQPEGGGMLAVRAGVEELAGLVAAEPLVSVAAVNGPAATVLSGDAAALARIREALAGQGLAATPLKVSHAFHSVLMEPALAGFRAAAATAAATSAAAAGTRPGIPRVPVFSTVTGSVLDGGFDLDYWCAHLTGTVRFADAARAMLRAGATHLVELGPKPVLTRMVRQLPGAAGTAATAVFRGGESGALALAEALAELYRGGVPVDWDPLYAPSDRVPVPLPPQRFDDSVRLWHRPPPAAAEPAADGPAAGPGFDSPTACVRAAVARMLELDSAEVRPDDRFYDDLGFDSVMFMELKYRLEESYPQLGELSIPEMMSSLVTVETLADYLDSQLTLVAA
ncbi:acyltransferase domain-containing protein [Streptacidiphilus sp. PB12-B1b]|uniref:type I polyketide synthase n=1 Tax=Streptacidiphilus sp. PB12-B1b TaxID=2705012 RepID=UPI0015FC4394|nr:type I polyketide synthase [Streptacidiphilus sp. PB12-B1b]QMU78141.1 acyltransferase domain-containing protein [Streptacidiphilus sp. PB12-B1b]